MSQFNHCHLLATGHGSRSRPGEQVGSRTPVHVNCTGACTARQQRHLSTSSQKRHCELKAPFWYSILHSPHRVKILFTVVLRVATDGTNYKTLNGYVGINNNKSSKLIPFKILRTYVLHKQEVLSRIHSEICGFGARVSEICMPPQC